MYAIVDIAGQQFKVEKEQKIFVNRLDGKEDSTVSFDNVLLIDNDGKIAVGSPIIEGASISAKIIEHLKADKIMVFKKKRRKGYKKMNGHRQLLTKIQIEKISTKGGSASGGAEKETKKSEIKKETASTKSKASAKGEEPKKAATKKTAKANTTTGKKVSAAKAGTKDKVIKKTVKKDEK